MEGPNSREGRVEVFYSGVWGEVCGAHWDVSDANVVCRSLGYGGASTFRVNITIIKQENDTVWLTGVRCIGNETSLSQCPHDGWGERTCSGNQAAGVTCFEQGWWSVLNFYLFLGYLRSKNIGNNSLFKCYY